jgi:hypothetical protein
MLGISFRAKRDAQAHWPPSAPSLDLLGYHRPHRSDAGERDDTMIIKREM